MVERGLFRWAGAKRHLIERVKPVVDAHRAETGGRLISGFFGSGAIERAVGGCAVAADASPELLGLYEDLQVWGPHVVSQAVRHFADETAHTKDGYNAARLRVELPAPLRSGRFIYLSSMAFNGIWRVNSQGVMNMPPDPKRLAGGLDALPPLSAFERFAEQIRGIVFVRGWERALARARPGDVGLFDPPYGEFDGYTAAGFESRDHRLLASALKEAVARGIAIIAFNAPEAAPIYHWAHVEEVTRSGCVSSKATARDPVSEIIITAGLRGQP